MAEEPGKPKSVPNVTENAQAAKAERASRLTAALRENLRRRNPTERKISERPGVKGANQEGRDKDG